MTGQSNDDDIAEIERLSQYVETLLMLVEALIEENNNLLKAIDEMIRSHCD